MAKNLVIFDGSNFYHRSKELSPNKHLSSLNYKKLVSLITKGHDNNICYCVGEMRWVSNNPYYQDQYKKQQAFIYSLQSQGVVVKKGFMMQINGKYHEKGVDVRIAVDLLKGALKSEYDSCFLISSDTDIIPVIEEARLGGKEVVYVGFSHLTNKAMSSNCSRTVNITKSMLDQC